MAHGKRHEEIRKGEARADRAMRGHVRKDSADVRPFTGSEADVAEVAGTVDWDAVARGDTHRNERDD